MAADNRLSGAKALIAGAASGIGLEVARAFLREDARVVIGNINPKGQEVAQGLSAEFGQTVPFIPVDVSSEDSIRKFVDAAAYELEGVCVLVQIAGVQIAGSVCDFSKADWDRTMAVNAKSLFLGAKHALPFLRTAVGATVTNTASAAGVCGSAGLATYSASQGAVIAQMKALAIEWTKPALPR